MQSADLCATDTKTNITAFDKSTKDLLFSKICLNESKLIEADTMSTLVDYMEHEGMGKGVVATALSIGYTYWSQALVDKDFYFTCLTVLAPEDLPHEHYHGKVLYYFVFPTNNIQIPLKSGNVLFFNPLILHSCSNPRYKDS